VVNFETTNAFRVEVEANHRNEQLQKIPLRLDDLDLEVRLPELHLDLALVADDDDADVGVVGTTVRIEIVIVGLQAVEEGLDGVRLRVREKVTASIDCEEE
jgi:hypothetical protein